MKISQRLKLHNFDYIVRYSDQDILEEYKTELNDSGVQDEKI